MKRGFYIVSNDFTIRCYYISGEKKGNKWIEIAGYDDGTLHRYGDAEWMALLWTCLPSEEELKDAIYLENL